MTRNIGGHVFKNLIQFLSVGEEGADDKEEEAIPQGGAGHRSCIRSKKLTATTTKSFDPQFVQKTQQRVMKFSTLFNFAAPGGLLVYYHHRPRASFTLLRFQ